MISRAFLVVLILVGGAGAGAARLVHGARAGGATMAGWGVGAILVVVACVVVVTYVVSRAHMSRQPPEWRAGRGAQVAAMLREFLAHLGAFAILAPFARFWVRDRTVQDGTHTDPPVVLVHGYLLNGAAWWLFARLLRRAGCRPFVATIEPVLGSIDEMGESLSRRIEEICAATGASRVNLVAHSMGGLVCRAYLRAHGTARVGLLVTIASPHHGTEIARLGVGQCAREMTPGSAWLAELADWEARSEPPPAVALFSYYDNYIAPQESSMLPWARNAPLPALGHVEMYFSRRVAEQVRDALRTRAA